MALHDGLPLYAFVNIEVGNGSLTETGDADDSTVIVGEFSSDQNHSMLVDFNWTKSGSDNGGNNSFTFTLFDETAIQAEAILAGATDNATSFDTNSDTIIKLSYGWASNGSPVPGRHLSFTGTLSEYSISFNGPSTELTVTGIMESDNVLSMATVEAFSGETYAGNPSDIVREIADRNGWQYTDETIVNSVTVTESTDSTTPKTYSVDSRSMSQFISEDLVRDAITEDGQSDFKFWVDSTTVPPTVYFRPQSTSNAGMTEVETYDEEGSFSGVSYSGGTVEGGDDAVLYKEYDYYVGKDNSEVISFTPSYTFCVGSATSGSGNAVDSETNEMYGYTATSTGIGITGGSDGVVRIDGRRMLGMSSSNYANLSTQATRLSNMFLSSEVTATLEIMGDPNIPAGNVAEVVVNVYTKYGIKHHTSGRYVVESVEENVTRGSYITTLSLKKLAGYTYSESDISDMETGNTQKAKTKKKLSSNDSIQAVKSTSDIVNYAQLYLGNDYVWGGNSLTNGIDCSHFVYQVLKNTGHYSGPYLTAYNWSGAGKAVSKEELKAGDIIVYSGSTNHVAIYVDETHIVHARNKNSGIVVTETDPSAYHGGAVAYRRVE